MGSAEWLKENLQQVLALPAPAIEWLLMLWNAIQVFDDVADGDLQHLIFRVEHVVDIRQDEGSESCYTAAEARACRNWLRKWAPKSQYA